MKRMLLCCAALALFLAAPLFAAEVSVSDFDTSGSTTIFNGGDAGHDTWADNGFDEAVYQGPSGRSFRLQWGNVNATNEYAGGCVYFNANPNTTTNISAYNSVSFFIYTPNANMEAEVKLADYVGAVEHTGKVRLSDYVKTVANTWQEVVIPIAAFQRSNPTLDLTQIRALLIVADVTNGLEYDPSGLVYIDNVKYSRQTHAPARSIVYSGSDKGTVGLDDVSGDTMLWWDQAASSVTSNEVAVTVSTGYAIVWISTPSATNTVSAGTTWYYAYQLRNDGNRADRVVFSTETVSGTWQARVYWDRDRSGTFTAGDAECFDSIGLLPDSTHFFLLGIYVPAGAANNSSTTIRLTARDNFGSGANDSWPTATNDDTQLSVITAVCATPSIALVKSTSTATGRPGANITYTLNITNSGSAAATNLSLVDVVPMNMQLAAAATGASATITYWYSGAWQTTWSANATKVRWVWASVAGSGGTASGSFQARIK